MWLLLAGLAGELLVQHEDTCIADAVFAVLLQASHQQLLTEVVCFPKSTQNEGNSHTKYMKFYTIYCTLVYKNILYRIITYGAKSLNADWLRQRAFFLNHEGTFGNQEGMIT